MVDYAAKLFNDAENYAKSRGFKFGDGMNRDFRRFAKIAAHDIELTPGHRRERLAEARHNFELMISLMILERRKFRDYPAGVIGEITFDAARRKLCPLWPFC